MNSQWIQLAVEGLTYAVEHRKELAEGAEVGIHVIRRLEHLCVKHTTTVDELLVSADHALHVYNENQKKRSTTICRSSS